MMSVAYTSNHTRRLFALACTLALVASMGCSRPSDDNNTMPADSGTDTVSDASSATALVSPESWAVIPAADDPVEDAPQTTMCDPENGTKVESLSGEQAFGVSTRNCEYVAVGQTTLAPLSEGDTVFVRAWHFELTAPTDAEAHLAVAIDGETIWQERVPIPSGEGGLLTSEWTATRDIPAGSDVVFHAHNHGNNEYYLLEVSRQ